MLRVILFAILLIILARLFWRVVDAIIEGAGGTTRQSKRGGKLERDPVCGTFVAPTSALSLTAGGATQYFCSERCRDEFLAR